MDTWKKFVASREEMILSLDKTYKDFTWAHPDNNDNKFICQRHFAKKSHAEAMISLQEFDKAIKLHFLVNSGTDCSLHDVERLHRQSCHLMREFLHICETEFTLKTCEGVLIPNE